MTAAAPVRPLRADRPPRVKIKTDFAVLSERIAEAGLFRRRYGYYAAKFAFMALLYVAAFAVFVAVGASWWTLAVAVGFGVLFTQAAFLGHDAAHRQIFKSGKANETAAYLVANFAVGLSQGWWQNKHTRHHANPNKVDADPDIAPSFVVFTPEDAVGRSKFGTWFGKRQGWMLFPLLTFEGYALHVSAFAAVFGRGPVKRRGLEITLLLARFGLLFGAIFLVLPFWMGVAFIAVQMAVFGVYMGASFAPNHKGMPIVPKDLKIDFLRRQVLMSRSIRGDHWIGFLMGGLNFQIEHHLFPHMPRPHLKKARPIVKQFCAERGIDYNEVGLMASYKIVIQYLNRVGLGERDPFDCPITAQFRTR